jgi:hypothetical protein
MKKALSALFADPSRLRALIRAIILLTTSFGLRLTVDQIAAIQLTAELVLQGAGPGRGQSDK